MTTSSTPSPASSDTESVCDRFVTALVTRDYAEMGTTLRPDVTFRALVPPGPFDLTGAAAVVGQFEQWFDGGRTFAVLGHSQNTVGGRVHAHWTLRRTSDAPDSTPLTAEQHAYLTVDGGIASIDLLCSGWQEAGA